MMEDFKNARPRWMKWGAYSTISEIVDLIFHAVSNEINPLEVKLDRLQDLVENEKREGGTRYVFDFDYELDHANAKFTVPPRDEIDDKLKNNRELPPIKIEIPIKTVFTINGTVKI